MKTMRGLVSSKKSDSRAGRAHRRDIHGIRWSNSSGKLLRQIFSPRANLERRQKSIGAQGQVTAGAKHQRADREMRRRQQDNRVDRQSPSRAVNFAKYDSVPSTNCSEQ